MNDRKKILVIEALDNNRGNKQMAMRSIECLSNVADVTVAELSGWFSTIPSNVKIENYNLSIQYKNPQIHSFFRSIKHLLFARKLDHENHYDCIFFLSYHTIAFYLAKLLFKKYNKRLYVLHHVNIDDLSRSKIKNWFFKRYVTDVNHFVFEPFMKDYLVKKYCVDKKNIFVLPHPKNEFNFSDECKKYDCLGISGSNDEKIIEEYINEEKNNKTFKKNNISILLRSKKYEYEDGYLKVVNNYFTDEEYHALYASAYAIVLLFPSSFKYRMSGSIIDALSKRKRVLLSDILLFRDYAERYPNVCRIGVRPKQVVEYIKKNQLGKASKEQIDDWNKFSKDHSSENIIKKFIEAFEL